MRMNDLAFRSFLGPSGKVLAFATLGLATSWFAAAAAPAVTNQLGAYLVRMAPTVAVSVALGVFFSRRGGSWFANVAIALLGWWLGGPNFRSGEARFMGLVGVLLEGIPPTPMGSLDRLLADPVGPVAMILWGVSFALSSAPILAVVAALFIRAELGRSPSLVASAYARLAWGVTLAACLGLVWWRGNEVLKPPPLQAVLTASAALMLALAALQIAALASIRTLFRRLAGLEQQPNLEPGPGAEICDLGVGEGYWAEAGPSVMTYRSGAGVRLVRGSAIWARGLLAGAAGLHAALSLVGLTFFSGVLGQWHAAQEARRHWALTAGDVETAPVPTTTSTADRPTVAWYTEPEALPFVFDVNGDRIEDVVGLRREHGQADAPFLVVAIAGQSFHEIWLARLSSKPGEQRPRMARSGANVFVRDGAGFVHVFDLTTGQERVDPVATPGAFDFCAVTRGELGVWLQTDASGALGMLVTAEGRATEVARPPLCAPFDQKAAKPRCGEGAQGTCGSPRKPESIDPTFASSVSYEEGKVGVSVGQVAASHGAGFAHLVGYAPSTGDRRWEQRLVSQGESWSAPEASVALGGGRIFATWEGDSVWKIRALDGFSGNELWSVPLQGTESSRNALKLITATERRVYLVSEGQLRVLDALSGAELGANP